jgi:WD40 repeat protein
MNGEHILIGGVKGQLRVVNTVSELTTHTLVGHTNTITCIVYNAALNVFISASVDGTARVWMPPFNGQATVVLQHPSPIESATIVMHGFEGGQPYAVICAAVHGDAHAVR